MAAFFLPACAGLTERVPGKTGVGVHHEAAALISMLNDKNAGLKTFKGKGEITYWKNNKINFVAGAAWIGSEPDRLRVALRSPSGQPLVSFSNDGKWFYLFSHAQGDYFKKRATDSNLKRITSIPIKTADMVSILSGRIPVHRHSTAGVLKNESGDGVVLVLKKWWGDRLEKVYFDETRKDVRKIEMFSGKNMLAYRTELYGLREINGYRIPSRLVFSTGDGSVFQLDINGYWPDIAVSPSVFELASPE
ncbi:MAG: hypothetical protein JRI75_01845 [Deltaproteobacteria bacterium]|nr:hypothetical protein [Deltaproteobacteria bacterium]